MRGREPRDVASHMAELRLLIESGQHLPGSRVLVDEERFIRTLDELRSTYVAELERARYSTRHRAEILAAADAEAERVVSEARRSAEAMLTDVGVRAAAEERAEDILGEAGRSSSQTEGSAWQYAMDRLVHLDDDLLPVRRALDEVRRGLGLPD